MNKSSVTVITNPGGSNERFVRANLPQPKVVVFNDNTTIFDEILKGNDAFALHATDVVSVARAM